MPYKFTGADEVFAFFQTFADFERKKKHTIREYRLDRMHGMLSLFGDPHKAVKTVHIAGSKGKGSTAIYIAKALEASGEVTGLYTSPHVKDYRERITHAGTYIDDEIMLECGNEIAAGIDRIKELDLVGGSNPTTFELLTLLAFLSFRCTGCSYAVIETGIGGRLDATNVVAPVASLITPVELEHTDVLGDTLEKIAGEKAGIIKEGVPLFLSTQHKRAKEVILKTARERHAPVFSFDEKMEIYSTETDEEGTRVEARIGDRGIVRLTLAMPGEFQAKNALLAYALVDSLQGPEEKLLPEEKLHRKIVEAMGKARLPGRMELIPGAPLIVLDGAHTPKSVTIALETYRNLSSQLPVCIFGSVYGKNAEAMADILAHRCSQVIVSRPGSFKPSEPEEVFDVFSRRTENVELILDAREAFSRALEYASTKKPILVIGSFYMVAQIRPFALGRALEVNKEGAV